MKGLIGTAIAVAVVIGSTILVLNAISPLLEEGKTNQAFIEAKNSLASIDNVMQQVLTESVGARRQVNVNLKQGKLIVAGDEEKIKLRLEGFTILQPGSTIQEGNIHVQGGGTIDALEQDIDGDGNTDLVLKNNALTFAVKKIGNSTNYVSINTSRMITEFYNNRTNTITYPGFAAYINDRGDTAAGTGYTALSTQGANIDSASILAYVNSTPGIKYEILFTLSAGMDFVDVEVKNIAGA